jgi:hypothetical protein
VSIYLGGSSSQMFIDKARDLDGSTERFRKENPGLPSRPGGDVIYLIMLCISYTAR